MNVTNPTLTAEMRIATKDGPRTVEDSDLSTPDPLVWPVCDTCGAAFILRRGYSLSAGMSWFWVRDCERPRSTCKNSDASIHDLEGKVPPDGR